MSETNPENDVFQDNCLLGTLIELESLAQCYCTTCKQIV